MTTGTALRNGSLALAFMVGMGLVIGEEPVSVTKPEVRSSAPAVKVEQRRRAKPAKDLWLGIEVSKPNAAVHAQLQGVPPGVGFVIDEVIPGGPASAAGVRNYDFVWKMDDQLLINTGQFLTLLNLRERGDKIALTVQRGGEDQVLEVELETRPEERRGQDWADSRIMEPSIPGLPSQIHDLLGRVAELRDASGTLRVWRRGSGFGWAQYDEFDLELQAGYLAELSDDAFPPDMDAKLRRKLEALVRGYQQAERNHRNNGRAPRVRRVPTPPLGGPSPESP